jgi:hypothetical protein
MAFGGERAIIVRVTDEQTRVVVADDDVLLREGLASLLQRSGFDIAGQAGDARQLVALVRSSTRWTCWPAGSAAATC